MPERYTRNRFSSSLSTGLEYFHDLCESTFDNHYTKLRLVINYFEREEPIAPLIAYLHSSVTGDYKDWLSGMLSGNEAFTLPLEIGKKAGIAYTLLYNIKRRRVELRSVLSRRFSGSGLDDRFKTFSAYVIKPLIGFLSKCSEGMTRIMEEADPDGSQRHDISQIFYTVLSDLEEAPSKKKAARKKAAKKKSRSSSVLSTKESLKKKAGAVVRRRAGFGYLKTPKKKALASTSSPPAKGRVPVKKPPRIGGPATAKRESLLPDSAVYSGPCSPNPLEIEGTPFEQSLRDLIYEISIAADLDRETQGDLLADVKMLRLELTKHAPRRQRVASLLAQMEKEASLSSQAKNALENFSAL